VECEHKIDIQALTVGQLLRDYGAILDELRRREIVRSTNNPVSDYAELLFCNAFGWRREVNSASGYDATDENGLRYQIKARRLTPTAGPSGQSRQLSAIRTLDDSASAPFDFLAGLLVDANFQVIRAALVPVAVVRQRSKYVKHTNSRRFLLHDDVWNLPGVKDVTAEVRAAAIACERRDGAPLTKSGFEK
jgi:hypothetical protein